MRSPLPLALPLLLLGGCTGLSDTAPSLLPRAIESRSDAEPQAEPLVSEPDPGFEAELARRARRFTDADAAFASVAATGERVIANGSGAAVGSDPWIAAQSTVSELEAARAVSESALADLEQLAIERGTAGKPPTAALDAAIEAGNAAMDRTNATLARLKGRLKAL